MGKIMLLPVPGSQQGDVRNIKIEPISDPSEFHSQLFHFRVTFIVFFHVTQSKLWWLTFDVIKVSGKEQKRKRAKRGGARRGGRRNDHHRRRHRIQLEVEIKIQRESIKTGLNDRWTDGVILSKRNIPMPNRGGRILQQQQQQQQ